MHVGIARFGAAYACEGGFCGTLVTSIVTAPNFLSVLCCCMPQEMPGAVTAEEADSSYLHSHVGHERQLWAAPPPRAGGLTVSDLSWIFVKEFEPRT
jgi:hypothetical protein